MKARDIISPRSAIAESLPERNISADMAVVDILPFLLDTPDYRLGVTDGDQMLGIIDASSMLKGVASIIAPRGDSSTIALEMHPSAYCASHIAHAVEDANVHLVDLWTSPLDGENMKVTLRVRSTDPSEAAACLERYGYNVVEVSGENNSNLDTAIERLLSLNTLLKV